VSGGKRPGLAVVVGAATPPGRLARSAQTLAELARAVVFAAPVYRASYPGVLKNLLDLLPVEALRAKPVGILAMGASAHHYLGVDTHLRAVLAWFGARCLHRREVRPWIQIKGTLKQKRPGLQTAELPSNVATRIAMRTDRAPFNDVRVRHAAPQAYYVAVFSEVATAVWDGALRNYGPNLGYDYGGRLQAAWLER
jgi:hypothetical protein